MKPYEITDSQSFQNYKNGNFTQVDLKLLFFAIINIRMMNHICDFWKRSSLEMNLYQTGYCQKPLQQETKTSLPGQMSWACLLSPIGPRAGVVNFHDEGENAFLVLWSSCIRKNLPFCLLCQPRAHMAPFGEQTEGLSTSGQREVLLKVCRHLRERERT